MKPKTLGWAAAAALPLTSLTAWELLFDRLRVPREGHLAPASLLVINGAGGVGSILVQLARKLTNLTIIATASRPETTAWVKSMGAHHVFDYREPLEDSVKSAGFETVDFIASLTASDRNQAALARLIAPQGHLAMIDNPPSFDIVPFKPKSVTISWEFMFTRSKFETADMDGQGHILREIAALVDAGTISTTLRAEEGPINAANLKRAHAVIESGTAFGKTVLAGF